VAVQDKLGHFFGIGPVALDVFGYASPFTLFPIRAKHRAFGHYICDRLNRSIRKISIAGASVPDQTFFSQWYHLLSYLIWKVPNLLSG